MVQRLRDVGDHATDLVALQHHLVYFGDCESAADSACIVRLDHGIDHHFAWWRLATAGYLPGLACDLTLRCVLWLVEVLSAVPFSHLWLPKVPAWWVAVFINLDLGRDLPALSSLATNLHRGVA